ncbi:MAG: hypothetical protein OXH11_07565 [Candidatus Aminicenantes bacterium]|nr:hypothetical protein [Candidatus Aminicenantes bacterium]
MLSTSHRDILHGYSVVRACLDDTSDHAVPVGVVAWDTPNEWERWRWLEQDEKVRGIDPATRRLMQITKNQIQRWANARRVPYEPAPAEPTCASFWKAVSEVLSTAVRLDPPKAMDPMDEPEAEIEWLFEAVVQPTQPRERGAQRIDSAINQALGELTDLIPSRPQVSAFGGTKEQVRRGLETGRGVLLVDGVNLAAATARKEADAFVSRFMRIRNAYGDRPVHIIVGYASSPGGLNGEAHMCEEIQEKLTDQVLEVVVEQVEFKMVAADAWAEVRGDPQTALPVTAGTEE